MNGEYFPGIHDHELSLENRVTEFCDKAFGFRRKANLKRKFTSHQNAAVVQYKIPMQGSFAISVKYRHNPKREKNFHARNRFEINFSFQLLIYLACNIMAEGVAPYYILQNYGTNRNCTLSASFPAVISIEGIDVGGNKGNVNYDVRKLYTNF